MDGRFSRKSWSGYYCCIFKDRDLQQKVNTFKFESIFNLTKLLAVDLVETGTHIWNWNWTRKILLWCTGLSSAEGHRTSILKSNYRQGIWTKFLQSYYSDIRSHLCNSCTNWNFMSFPIITFTEFSDVNETWNSQKVVVHIQCSVHYCYLY